MAETMSVKAILSAVDRGFTSTINSARTAVGNLGSAVKGGIGFGIAAATGMAAFNAISNGARGLITELNDSNKAWKTFNANMEIMGASSKDIAGVKKDLSDFAQQSIYNASYMASTYAQLAAVGTESTLDLVKGFAGLAASATEPKQAMKTLSQQATQMAARPTVAWQDFKLMLDQAPAGMASVAKQMGMTSDELVAKIQAGEVATKDFFAAISAVGNSDAFANLATTYKSADEAMMGLYETLGVRLGPAFEVLNLAATNAITGIISAVEKINAEELATKVSNALQAAQPYWEAFKSVIGTVAGILKTLGNFMLEHADIILKVIPVVLALVAAYNAFKVVNVLVPYISAFTKSLTTLANGGIKGLSKKLFETAAGEEKVGKAAKVSGKNMLFAATSFAIMGVGVLAIAAGFYLLARASISLAESGGYAVGIMFLMVGALTAAGVGAAVLLKSISKIGKKALPAAESLLAIGVAVMLVAIGFAVLSTAAINLANAGGLAIGVMAGMVIAIGALMALAAAVAPQLAAGAPGLLAFGAAMLLIGLAAIAAAYALQLVAAVLPIVSIYGFQGAAAIALLGAGMLAFAIGAGLAGAACVILGAGLVVAAAGLTLIAASILVVSAGIIALSAAIIVLSAGVVALGAGLTICATAFVMMGGVLPSVATSSLVLVASFTMLLALSAGLAVALVATTVAIVAFGAGMTASAAGVLVMNAALGGVSRKITKTANSAASTVSSFVKMAATALLTKSSFSSLGTTAKSSMKQVEGAMKSAASTAETSGKKIGNGFTNGMKSGLSQASPAATQTVNSIISALNAGYGRAYSAGGYIGQGLVNGLRSKFSAVRAAADELVKQANRAMEAAAKIGSPSKITTRYGKWYGQGWVNGIDAMVSKAKTSAENLFSLPNLDGITPSLAGGFDLPGDYEYYRNAEIIVDIPLTVDGREIARATATYTEEELNKQHTRNNRKKGRL